MFQLSHVLAAFGPRPRLSNYGATLGCFTFFKGKRQATNGFEPSEFSYVSEILEKTRAAWGYQAEKKIEKGVFPAVSETN
jgi:hypothetical protein